MCGTLRETRSFAMSLPLLRRRCAAAGAIAVAMAGCSLVYDPDVFVTDDAAPPVDAVPPPPDVDPSALMLQELDPPELAEGLGAGRAIPVVIHGSSIASNAVVTLDGAGFDAELVDTFVSGNGQMAAFAISVPVRTDLANGAVDTITVTVTQGDGIERSLPLQVTGLDELDVTGPTVIDVATLRARYSRIAITDTLILEGAAPARLVATSSAVVDAPIMANGGAAALAVPGTAGPGGCRGGAAESPGDCLAGGGRAGGSSAGGGGAGHATMGSQGAGGAGGPGGAETGSVELVSLAEDGGHGGGGGGPGSLSGAGGAGGGGGGVIEITSMGTLTIGPGARFDAAGGAGHQGSGACAVLDQHGGGGGGGAGGAVLVRAAAMLVDEAATERVSVAGGPKGDAGCNAGGDGADGRVRVDVPTASPTPAFAGATLYRGPVLAPATPAIAMSAPVDVELFGGAGTTYYVEREGGARQAVAAGSDRRASAELTLEPGANRVCAIVTAQASISSAEGTNCITVAYIQP